jgi:uncharacterized protein (TIGR03083 family)
MAIEFERACALVERESGALAAAAAAVPAATRVPSCPDWTMGDLVAHHVRVLLWWAAVVRDATPAAPPAQRPEQPDEPAGWYQNAIDELITALRDAGPDGPSWTWWGEPRTAAAVARHQVQEAMVHRWDAETAAGRTPGSFPEDAALDGVEEYLVTMLSDATGPVGGLVAVTATGAGGSGRWVVDGRGERPVVLGGDVPEVDVELRAAAGDLVLALYGRVPMTALQVTGDAALADRFLAAADTT